MKEVPFSLETVVSGLEEKIRELETLRDEIGRALNDDANRATNMVAFQDVISSLEAAQVGKLALMKGCCTRQNCKFEYEPAPGVGRAV